MTPTTSGAANTSSCPLRSALSLAYADGGDDAFFYEPEGGKSLASSISTC